MSVSSGETWTLWVQFGAAKASDNGKKQFGPQKTEILYREWCTKNKIPRWDHTKSDGSIVSVVVKEGKTSPCPAA